MAKRVFFSFHYQDVIDFRANVVRNHWMTKPNRESSGFFDASIWEDAKKTSDIALKRLINGGLDRTTVTAILVGTYTYQRRWVHYEIMKSIGVGNKILAIHINGIKGKDGNTKNKGSNPLYYLGYSFNNTGTKLSLHNFINNEWVEYKDLDGWSVNKVSEEKRNKIFRLSTLYPTYDWIEDDGYNNFEKWVGN